MTIIVPDASVLLKWVLPSTDEEDQQKALKIRELAITGQLILKVPSLWLYEIGNTLSRKFPKQADEIIQTFLSIGLIEGKWNEQWLAECLLLTDRYGVTFYDAAYHGLALVEKGLFITADQQYIKKAQAAGAVIALCDWS